MTRLARLAAVAAVLSAAACSDEHYLIVSVSGRPAVHGAATMKVTLGNEGSMRVDDFDLAGRKFPVTFAVSSPDRTGALSIGVEALDANGLVVGQGTVTSAFADETAAVLLDSTDFVVNTTVADDQFLSNDYEANGNQLGATDDGSFMVTYREACLTPCHMFGRRFDATGTPLDSGAAAGTLAFPLSTTLTTSASTPAVAGAGTTTLAFWDYNDTVRTETGIACRAIDGNGNASSTQTSVAIDSADVVNVTALSNRNYAVTWISLPAPTKIQSIIVKPDCVPLGGVAAVATELTGDIFQRPTVTADPVDANVLFTWINNAEVHVRIANNAGAFTSADTIIIPSNATDRVSFTRTVPYGDGFAVLARWEPLTGDGPGRIDLYRVSSTGAPVNAQPILITDKSGGDFSSAQSFGAAARSDGTVLVVWHGCGVNGDDSGCGVWARAVKGTAPIGEAFLVPTTRTADQTDPSVVASGDAFVVAWNDMSGAEPDRSKLAVRARIVYLDGAGTQ